MRLTGCGVWKSNKAGEKKEIRDRRFFFIVHFKEKDIWGLN